MFDKSIVKVQQKPDKHYYAFDYDIYGLLSVFMADGKPHV